MKLVIYVTLFIGIVGCSSSPFKETTKEQDMVNQHLSQGVKFLEGDFNDKYSKTGRTGVYVTAVGSAIYPQDFSTELAKAKARANAKFSLIESAPTEFRKEVQQAIGTEIGGVGEFSQIDVSVSEVQNLTGIEVKHEDTQCRTRVEPTSDGGYQTMKECRAIARIKASELKKAYDFTISEKYGVTKGQIAESMK